MTATRQQLHNMIDIIDSKELPILYQVLVKFLPEDAPTSDEIEAIKLGREEILQGDFVDHDDIDWS